MSNSYFASSTNFFHVTKDYYGLILFLKSIMKKMTMKVTLRPFIFTLMNKYVPIGSIKSAEVLDIIKVDMENYFKIVLVKIIMKPDHHIDELLQSNAIEIISTIEKDDRSITCLMKGKPPIHLFSKIGHITKEFNVNVIWDIPSRMNGKEFVISAIGNDNDLSKVAKACKLLGSIDQISFSKDFLQGVDILACLTDKQRKILIKAKEQGYYEYPRKIDTDRLSKIVSLSKSTTVEHLRKAENRLISTVLSGY